MPPKKILTGTESAACGRMRHILNTVADYSGYTLSRDEAFELRDLAAKIASVFPYPCTKCGGDVDGQGFLGPPVDEPPPNPVSLSELMKPVLLHRLCQTCFDAHQEAGHAPQP